MNGFFSNITINVITIDTVSGIFIIIKKTGKKQNSFSFLSFASKPIRLLHVTDDRISDKLLKQGLQNRDAESTVKIRIFPDRPSRTWVDSELSLH